MEAGVESDPLTPPMATGGMHIDAPAAHNTNGPSHQARNEPATTTQSCVTTHHMMFLHKLKWP